MIRSFTGAIAGQKNLEIWSLTVFVSKTALKKPTNFTKQNWKLLEGFYSVDLS